MTRRIVSPETRERISRSLMGHKQSEQTIEKIRQRLIGSKRSKETRELCSMHASAIQSAPAVRERKSIDMATIRALIRLGKRLGFTPGTRDQEGNITVGLSK